MTADHWRRLVREQQRSGLSVGAFCAERSLAASTFFAWRRKLRQDGGDGAPAFVEVTAAVQQAESPAALADGDEAWEAPIELVLPCGVVVRVRRGVDIAMLREVLEVLR
jgi:transposase-like protein